MSIGFNQSLLFQFDHSFEFNLDINEESDPLLIDEECLDSFEWQILGPSESQIFIDDSSQIDGTSLNINKTLNDYSDQKKQSIKRKREERVKDDQRVFAALMENKKQRIHESTSQCRKSEPYQECILQDLEKPFSEFFRTSFDAMDSPEVWSDVKSHKKKEPMIKNQLDPTHLWEEVSFLARTSVESKVAKQNAFSNGLQSNALDYPILSTLKRLEARQVEDVPSFNPLLKPYQRQEINQLLHFIKMKASRLLAFDMGLGKTFVFSEFSCQMLAQCEGTILVVVPKSLLQTVTDEITRAITHSLAYAYKALGSTRKVLDGTVREINRALEKKEKERLSTLVPLFALFDSDLKLKIQLADVHCFDTRHQDQWSYLKEDLKKQISVLTTRLDSVKKALLESLVKSQSLSRLPSHNLSVRKEWERQLQHALEFPELWLQNVESNLCNCCTSPIFFEECVLVGKLLDVAVELPPPSFPLLKLERFCDFSTSKIVSCFDLVKLEKSLRLKGSQILITTHEKLAKVDRAIFEKTSISSIIVDEAQKMHTQETHVHSYYRKLVDSFSEEKRPAIVFASGTPLENHFGELWTLLDLCNPKQFSASTYNTLNLLFESSKKILLQQRILPVDSTLKETFVRAFAQFELLRKFVVDPMVGHLTKLSPQVIHAWKDGIPTRTDHVIQRSLNDKAKQAIDKIERNYNESKNFLACNKNSRAVLLHPSLIDQSTRLTNPKIQAIITQLKTSDYDPSELFQNSPILSSLLYSRPMEDVNSQKEHAIVVTSHRATAKIIKLAIMRRFLSFQPQIKVFHGGLSANQREKKIQWFRNGDDTHPKLLILLAKAGGVGLNLPQANKVFMVTMDWNPAVDEQAIARVLRVGSPGHKDIYWFKYDMFVQHHQQAIQESKRAWESFFFNKDQNISVRNQFQKWCGLLESCCYQTLLINKKEVKEAVLVKEQLHEILKRLCEKIEISELEQAVKNCLPVQKSVIPVDYPRLPMSQCVIIPTTISNGSWVKTVALGHALKLWLKSNPQETKAFLKRLSEAFTSHAEWRQMIRKNCFIDTTDFINKGLLQIKEKRPSEMEPFLQTDYRIEFYQLRSGGLERYSIHNEDKSEVIRLYQKKYDGKHHYDLIALL